MIPQEAIREAQRRDPTDFLEREGYTVRREGRHLSVRWMNEEKFRVTEKTDGRWIACDKHQNGIGDNIALYQAVRPCRFTEAVEGILGRGYGVGSSWAVPLQVQARAARTERRPADVPSASDMSIAEGIRYLGMRGIDRMVVCSALENGFMRLTQGAICFCGRDDVGKVRNVHQRATDPEAQIQKRDYAGSDKSYPAVLPGNVRHVAIVEGAFDALAFQTLARQNAQNNPIPTVLVSGGAGVRSFLENPEVQYQLQRADVVTIVRDNDRDPQTREISEAARDKQRERVLEIVAGASQEVRVVDLRPPEEFKDFADYNLHVQRERRGDLTWGDIDLTVRDVRERQDVPGAEIKFGTSETVWLVSCKHELQAAMQLAEMMGKPCPTIIAVPKEEIERGLLSEKAVQKTLERADKVVMIGNGVGESEAADAVRLWHGKPALTYLPEEKETCAEAVEVLRERQTARDQRRRDTDLDL